MFVNSRAIAAADALGSTRAEGLEPSKDVLLLIERWSRGEMSSADLREARSKIAEAASIKPVAVSH